MFGTWKGKRRMTNDFIVITSIDRCHVGLSSYYDYWLRYYFIAFFHHEVELRQRTKNMNVTSLRSNKAPPGTNRPVSVEIRIAKIATMNGTLWVMAWTPLIPPFR
jgi:hypothetical protein